jgi:glycosyltransferase involved in cell wall biosynthesis
LDAVALTSFNEGTPVSLIEAQAAGRAIVSTRVGGIENVVKEGVTALLSANNNAEKFGMNLLRVVEDRNLRTRMAEAGWAHVHDRYHYTRLVEDTAKLYRALTA